MYQCCLSFLHGVRSTKKYDNTHHSGTSRSHMVYNETGVSFKFTRHIQARGRKQSKHGEQLRTNILLVYH